MTLQVPRLDDRTFDQLVTEGRSLIPRYTGVWTNHNPSDPGITLLELFAYLTETAIFQLDQVPTASIEHFLRLVGICRAGETEPIATAVGRAVSALQAPRRAVTASDFETLAQQAASSDGGPDVRARYVLDADPRCPRDEGEDALPAPLALVVVVPRQPGARRPRPSGELTENIFAALREQRILTTRLHVVGPHYTEVRLRTTVVRKPGSGLTKGQVEEAIVRFLDPLAGWFNGEGWPFGRPIHRSELFQVLEGMRGVDHVARLESKPMDADEWLPFEQIDLGAPTGLVDAPLANITATIEDVGEAR